MRNPRPINPDDYTPKPMNVDPYERGFKTREEREKEYFADYERYNENKSKDDVNQFYRGADREELVVLRARAVLCRHSVEVGKR